MSTPPDFSKLHLPQLRGGLNIAFSDYDPDGNPQWVIHDGVRGKFYVIGWQEFELLKRWDIGDPIKLVAAVNAETPLVIELSDLEHLLRFLAHNFLIRQSSHQILRRAQDQKLFKDENIIHYLIRYYLFFRIPLLHPDKFLSKTRNIGKIVFSRTLLYIMVILAIMGLYQLSMRWDLFTHSFASVFTWQGLIFSMAAFLVCKFFHELGHAYMCKHFNIPVPTLGVAFLVFWPVLYTDTTLSWSLNNKQRLRVALAGIWVETYVSIIALLIWCNTHNLTLQAVCYVTITVNWLSSLLVNVSPFMRFDGYYVLADFLKMPNLQFRAFDLTRWQLRRWLFNWTERPPERFSKRLKNILIIYSLATWIYRLSLYLGIAVLVYHFVIKIVGIILFIIEMIYFLCGPVFSEVKYWIVHREKIHFNMRTRITTYTTAALILLFFLPVAKTIELPATIHYFHQFIYAPEDSIIIDPLPPPGTQVKAQQLITQLKSPELEYSLLNANLEYQKSLNELRRASINAEHKNEYNILLSDLAKDQTQRDKYVALINKLKIVAPFNGTLIETAYGLPPGTVLAQNEWLGDIILANILQVDAYIQQVDRGSIYLGEEGYFYPDDITEKAVPVRVISVETLDSSKLNCHPVVTINHEEMVVEAPCYHANELGGQIATFLRDDGDYAPIDSIYRVSLLVTRFSKINQVMRGTVVLKTAPHSTAVTVFYKIKRIWEEQSGF